MKTLTLHRQLASMHNPFMNMNSATGNFETWQETYKVTSFLVNLRGQAGLATILSFIQDVGWQHAIQMKIELPANLGWIFTRQHLDMLSWPKWNQEVTVQTWLRPPQSEHFLFRDYELFTAGQLIGTCTSSFSVMDRTTRKLAAMDFQASHAVWRKTHLHSTTPQKLPPLLEPKTLAQFEVRNSDIDINNHVNNTKYAQWIFDSISIENLRGGSHLLGYEVNFLAEAKKGDHILIQQGSAIAGSTPSQWTIPFLGLRREDQRPVFSAHLRTELDAHHPANKALLQGS